MLSDMVEYKRFVWEFNNSVDLNKDIVFVCVGTTRLIGDSFGPLVGTVLKRMLEKNDKVTVIGDLQNCVTYKDIRDKMHSINSKYSNSLIIVVDSALADKSNIGKIYVQKRGLKYAESLKKANGVIGNISIKAVVGENCSDSMKNFYNLKDVSIQRIEYVSSIVANGIVDVMNRNENNGKNIYKW